MADGLQRVGGVESVAEILNLTDRTTEKSILESLGEEDPDMVEQIRRLMFVFEDILLVNDRGIQSVLKEVETSDLTLALRAEVLLRTGDHQTPEVNARAVDPVRPVRADV